MRPDKSAIREIIGIGIGYQNKFSQVGFIIRPVIYLYPFQPDPAFRLVG